jgi:hypothetical protein
LVSGFLPEENVMMQHVMRASIAALILAALPGAVAAQVRGLPVYNPGVPSGIGIYGDVGFPNATAGDGTTLALTGRAGFGPLGVTATIGTFNPAGPSDSRTVLGATGNVRVFGGGLVPIAVTVQGGYGRLNLGTGTTTTDKEERFPLGVGVAVTLPTPVVSLKPWLAPRLDIVRTTVGGTSSTGSNFGLSGGLEVNTLTGLGVHASYDYVRSNGQGAGIFGIGLHAGLKIPGL